MKIALKNSVICSMFLLLCLTTFKIAANSEPTLNQETKNLEQKTLNREMATISRGYVNEYLADFKENIKNFLEKNKKAFLIAGGTISAILFGKIYIVDPIKKKLERADKLIDQAEEGMKKTNELLSKAKDITKQIEELPSDIKKSPESLRAAGKNTLADLVELKEKLQDPNNEWNKSYQNLLEVRDLLNSLKEDSNKDDATLRAEDKKMLADLLKINKNLPKTIALINRRIEKLVDPSTHLGDELETLARNVEKLTHQINDNKVIEKIDELLSKKTDPSAAPSASTLDANPTDFNKLLDNVEQLTPKVNLLMDQTNELLQTANDLETIEELKEVLVKYQPVLRKLAKAKGKGDLIKILFGDIIIKEENENPKEDSQGKGKKFVKKVKELFVRDNSGTSAEVKFDPNLPATTTTHSSPEILQSTSPIIEAKQTIDRENNSSDISSEITKPEVAIAMTTTSSGNVDVESELSNNDDEDGSENISETESETQEEHKKTRTQQFKQGFNKAKQHVNRGFNRGYNAFTSTLRNLTTSPQKGQNIDTKPKSSTSDASPQKRQSIDMQPSTVIQTKPSTA